MGDLLIRNIPESLKRELAEAAGKAHQSLSAKAIELLQHGIRLERESGPRRPASAWDEMRAALGEAPEDEFSEILEEIETERKRNAGRPIEAFG